MHLVMLSAKCAASATHAQSCLFASLWVMMKRKVVVIIVTAAPHALIHSLSGQHKPGNNAGSRL